MAEEETGEQSEQFTMEKEGMSGIESAKLVPITPEEQEKQAQEKDEDEEKRQGTWKKALQSLDKRGLHPLSNLEIVFILGFGIVAGAFFNSFLEGSLQKSVIFGLVALLVFSANMFTPKSKVSRKIQRIALEFLERNAPEIYKSMNDWTPKEEDEARKPRGLHK